MVYPIINLTIFYIYALNWTEGVTTNKTRTWKKIGILAIEALDQWTHASFKLWVVGFLKELYLLMGISNCLFQLLVYDFLLHYERCFFYKYYERCWSWTEHQIQNLIISWTCYKKLIRIDYLDKLHRRMDEDEAQYKCY